MSSRLRRSGLRIKQRNMHSRNAVGDAARLAARFDVESLESRRLLATITVTTTADDLVPNNGTVSLREALTALNAGNNLGDPDIVAQTPGTFGVNDTINFSIAGAGVKTINVGSAPSASGIPLPTSTKPRTINGYSQPSATANTLANADNAVLLIELMEPAPAQAPTA